MHKKSRDALCNEMGRRQRLPRRRKEKHEQKMNKERRAKEIK
jgi:hypothetical protein